MPERFLFKLINLNGPIAIYTTFLKILKCKQTVLKFIQSEDTWFK